jgi:predicted secreted protein
MKTIAIILLHLCSLFLSLAVMAAEGTQVNFIGYTEKGDYLAFEEYGEHEGSGVPYSDIFIIDVSKNRYAIKPIKTNPRDVAAFSLDETREFNQKQAQAQLDKLDILPNNTGQQVIAHGLLDLGVDPHQVEFALYPPIADYLKTKFKLKLTEIETEESCYGFGKGKKMQLSLQKNADKAVYLQNDKTLPPTRGCPLAYRIQDVFVYHEKQLAVFLNLILPGHEGKTLRYRVVTGQLP